MTIDENGWNHDLREKLEFTPVTLAAAHLSVFLSPEHGSRINSTCPRSQAGAFPPR
jgi:hypothetical protein